MCVGCQEMKNKKELLRVVRTPNGEVILDSTGKKAGRGAYVCRSEQCFAKAFKEKRLERALKQTIEAEVYELLRSGITNE
ncbi:MAG TPA: YlxR family protein [Methylomusa anaerophila]|nr:YlxR family protein [Methylomusa anaerophila]HML87028.1 YlxR family protein [Methylomusa anaerophila]